MFMRIFSGLALALALAGCGSAADPAKADDEEIACAVGGSAKFDGACMVEHSRQGDMDFLVVHHPDGGFRRFEVRKDGGGLKAADGADVATSRLDGAMLEVSVGDDQYRFPVAVNGASGAAAGDAAKP